MMLRTLMAIASVTALTVWTAQWPARAGVQLPHYDHVVIVVEENHAASQIIGNKSAPFINTLAANGALMTQAFAVAHPSEPNYLALFAGNTFGGVDSDACPLTLGGPEPNLAAELIASRYSFGGFRRRPARGRVDGMRGGRKVRPQACAMGKFQQCGPGGVDAIHLIRCRAPPASDGVLRRPQSGQRHA